MNILAIDFGINWISYCIGQNNYIYDWNGINYTTNLNSDILYIFLQNITSRIKIDIVLLEKLSIKSCQKAIFYKIKDYFKNIKIKVFSKENLIKNSTVKIKTFRELINFKIKKIHSMFNKNIFVFSSDYYKEMYDMCNYLEKTKLIGSIYLYSYFLNKDIQYILF